VEKHLYEKEEVVQILFGLPLIFQPSLNSQLPFKDCESAATAQVQIALDQLQI
jgi:hypothetical protein